ncbi:SDR family NAD(P)-dependent oxidoreductase [Pseudogracilibacillus auburnensis]|uniref:Glucose 1-dehydrogenase/3-oxoacyl-[acyl-carrier protein] reductase n=1 Tax=Pseudogracilibacillus auburnensis TaxID=1494959 RepID=A0A2V3VWJ9_9BACI|nr:glucose 1-dehydrogenase [Pseudogracilibacillus auburnensis]PXW86292.1 glucose 1-dehydrogenase/3-oxoacyl-[acyl-carrier protein] reductase [Pseudogracilibacillus auburnensis]
MEQLDGKVALITGSSQGIGEAIVRKLADAGATVIINYRSDKSLENAKKIVADIENESGKAYIVKADMASVEQINKMFDEIEEKVGQVDILVNNAGVAPFYSFMNVTEEIWDNTYDINVKGYFFCTQRAAKSMIEKRSGKIINIASTASKIVTSPVIPHYISSKGAIHQLTKALAIELGKHNINVNAVGPSTVDTPFVADYLKDPKIREQEKNANPMKRIGTADQIGDSVVFLASKQAEQINGHLLMVDGGLSVQGPQPADHMER